MPSQDARPKPAGNDPEDLTRLLNLELIQKRAAWQQATGRHKRIKSASIFFLFVVILAALAGFYFVFLRVNEQRGQQRSNSQASPARP
jgi:hypothetical protein